MESDKWKVESDKWKVESDKWKVESTGRGPMDKKALVSDRVPVLGERAKRVS